MTEEAKRDSWPESGLSESERVALLSIYGRLEADMIPVVVEYKKAKEDVDRLYKILDEATAKGRGLLAALLYTRKQADAMIAAWDRTKKERKKR